MKIKIFSYTPADTLKPHVDQATAMMEAEINEWLDGNPEIISKDVVQSSCADNGFHDTVTTIVFMYK